MVRPVRVADIVEVTYDEEHWRLFNGFRRYALGLMRALASQGLDPLLHGSVARGDVDEDSDVDLFIPMVEPSYRVEFAIQEAGFRPIKREVVMATPWQLPKAHIHLDKNKCVTFPLVEPRPLELEFYHFGGAVGLEQVEEGTRVPGVDKRLMLIQPTPQGHIESPVLGREAEVAKLLGVSLDIVHERVQVLTRRAKIGHTGIFLQRELAPDENFEAVFRQLVKSKPAMRLRLKEG